MKRLYLLLVLLVLALAACGSTTTQATPTGNTNTSATQSAQAQATNEAQATANVQATNATPPPSATSHYKVGDTVGTADNFDVTVNKVYTSQGADYETPPQGDQYLIVDVSTKNMTGQVQHMYEGQFTLTDDTGQQMTWTVASGLPDMHPYIGGVLQPGATMRGALVYEVPVGKHSYQLAFSANSFGDTQTIWDIHS